MVFATLIGVLSFLDGSKLKASLLGIASEFYKINEQVQNTVYSVISMLRNGDTPGVVPSTSDPPKPEIKDVLSAIKSMTEELKTEIVILKQSFGTLEERIIVLEQRRQPEVL